jgi:hypothetical protein
MGLRRKIADRKKQADESIEYLVEEILTSDAEKEEYDSEIKKIDKKLVKQINIVNQSIADVGIAYQNRIDAGCRSDLFWRVIGTIPGSGQQSPPQYILQCTKISKTGYPVEEPTALNPTGFATYLARYTGGDSLTGIVSVSYDTVELPDKSKVIQDGAGFSVDNFHGLKYVNQPITKDIGDTTVASFSGIVGFGSTALTMLSRYSDNLFEEFEIGQRIICDKPGVFSQEVNTIVGFSSAIIDMSVVSAGLGVTSALVIALETPTIGFASAPQSDGSLVDFTVIDNPVGIKTYNDYAIPFAKNPFSPEEHGIVTGDTLGIGISVYYTNSGLSSSTDSWKPENAIEGYEPEIPDVKPPRVGAGQIVYVEGFEERPVDALGNPAEDGDIIHSTLNATTIAINPLYEPTPSCSSEIDNALTDAIADRDAKEAALASDLGRFNKRVLAVNALRNERDFNYNARIFTCRSAIGGEIDEKNRLDALLEYLTQEDIET